MTVDPFIGQSFGRLTALAFSHRWNGHRYYVFNCACGNEGHVASIESIRRYKIKGCGCIKRETATGFRHGGSGTKLFKIWKGMNRRCARSPRYAGRGIKVDPEWRDFVAFRDWANANGYADGLEIDRIDNDRDYTPSNCRWATRQEQMNNTSQTRYIEWRGRRLSLANAARETGISRETISYRLNSGWDSERALTTAVQGRGSRPNVAV